MPDRYAVLMNASTDGVGPAVNGLEYALDLDGAATKWADRLEAEPDHPVAEQFEQVEERDLVAGACGHCTTTFDATEGIEARGIEVLGGDGGHGPAISELVETHELLTIGLPVS